VELANKVGASEIINRIVDDLKDENEQYRKMVMETIEKVCSLSVRILFLFCFVVFFCFWWGGSFKVSLTASLFVLQTMGNLGSSDVDSRLEEQLIDGILYAFQEQTQEVHVFLTHCAAVVDFVVLSEGSKHW